jgi:hypothetical protein
MNEEVGKFQKDVVMAWSLYYTGTCLQGLRKAIKIVVRIASDRPEIQTKHLKIHV